MIITGLNICITDNSRLISLEEMQSLAAYGDKKATNSLIKGERIIEQRSLSVYIDVDIVDKNNHWSKRYSGSRETMPDCDNFKNDQLFIDALENWK